MKDLIYVAGPLNGKDAAEYITNLHKMTWKSCDIRGLNAATICPGNDFIEGVVHGYMEYEDYTENTMEIMKRCDAVYVMEGSDDSKGVQAEIKEAVRWGIPVFYEENLDIMDNAFLKWLNRPKIMAIVGESGTGKTTVAEWIEKAFDIPMIRSYTDRSARENDTSHTFLSKKQFDKIPKEEMIVLTEFGGHRYCCQHKDIQPYNTYVIEEDGFLKLKNIYKSQYRVEGLRLIAPKDIRMGRVGAGRCNRDNNKFNLPLGYYDYVYRNDKSKKQLIDFMRKLFTEWRYNIEYQTDEEVIKELTHCIANSKNI